MANGCLPGNYVAAGRRVPQRGRPMRKFRNISRAATYLQHVAGGVDVAVEDKAAAVAAVHPCAKRLRPVGIAPASAASLGGAARVDKHHGPTGACSLAAQHVPQPPPRGVVHRPGEKRALQRLHVQVLRRDHAMPGSQAVGELVQEVAARGGDAAVVTRQVPAGLGAALRVPFLPRQRPLQPPRPRPSARRSHDRSTPETQFCAEARWFEHPKRRGAPDPELRHDVCRIQVRVRIWIKKHVHRAYDNEVVKTDSFESPQLKVDCNIGANLGRLVIFCPLNGAMQSDRSDFRL